MSTVILKVTGLPGDSMSKLKLEVTCTHMPGLGDKIFSCTAKLYKYLNLRDAYPEREIDFIVVPEKGYPTYHDVIPLLKELNFEPMLWSKK